MHNYYALALCILTNSTVDHALRVQGLTPGDYWSKSNKPNKSDKIKNIALILMFACGFNKTEVAKMLDVHIQTLGEALTKAGAPYMDYRVRENSRRKKNG